jgi:glycyl-tRNA synthetase
MEPIFNINGLIFWNEREIHLRRTMEAYFEREMRGILLNMNPAWQFFYFEAPLLTPRTLINPNYTDADVWVQGENYSGFEAEWRKWMVGPDNINKLKARIAKRHKSADVQHLNQYVDTIVEDLEADINQPTRRPYWADIFREWLEFTNNIQEELVLRPETTPGSYAYAGHLLNHQKAKPPFVVWQAGKSFRREQDQVTKNMRLKEFYQQEFQCIFTEDTFMDYHTACLEPVRKMISEQVPLSARLVDSDRLPSYSLKTIDVELDNGDKWMEVASISKRIDFPIKAQFQAKDKVIEKSLLVVEIAIGLDRLIYNWGRAHETKLKIV